MKKESNGDENPDNFKRKKKFLLEAALVGLSVGMLAPTNVVNEDEIYYENQYGANQN